MCVCVCAHVCVCVCVGMGVDGTESKTVNKVTCAVYSVHYRTTYRILFLKVSATKNIHSCKQSRISLDCPVNCPSVPLSRKLNKCPGPACQLASFPDTEDVSTSSLT